MGHRDARRVREDRERSGRRLMARLIAPNGASVNVSDEKSERLVSQGYRLPGAGSAGSSSYSAMKVAELRSEIESRNEGRDDDSLLSTEGKKAELVAVLEGDDTSDDE